MTNVNFEWIFGVKRCRVRDYFKITSNKNKWLPIVTKKYIASDQDFERLKKNQFIYELIWVYVIILLRSMEGVIDDALQSHTNRIYFFFHFVSFLDKYQPWASIIIELACDHRLTNIMSTVRNQGVSQQFIHILHVQHVTRMNFKMKRCIFQQFEI